MRLVIQRVVKAGVQVAGVPRVEIGKGLVVLVGVAREDTRQDAEYLARKTADLRIFDDGEGKMNLSLRDVQGACLVVSQFTLYGDCRKGNRPSYIEAAPPESARGVYEHFANRLQAAAVPVKTGVFQAEMVVDLENDGPVTLIMESKPS